MIYLPVADEAEGLTLSETLWHLCRPDAVRDASEVTQRLSGVEQDENGEWFLGWDEETPVEVHPLCSEAELAAVEAVLAQLEGDEV